VKGLRIGYLVQQFPPEVGAGPARVLEMAAHWISHGATVTVFTGMPNKPESRIHPEYRGKVFVAEDWQGIQVKRSWEFVTSRSGFAGTLINNVSFMVTSALVGALLAGRIDVLIASAPPFFPHMSGYFVSGLRRIPLVLEARDMWPDYLVGMGALRADAPWTRALFAMERRLLQRADAVVVVTESFRRRVVEKGVPYERIHLMPNGVDTAAYYRAPEPPPFDELKPDSGVFRIGYLGNFGAGQALSFVLDAAARLQAGGAPVRFVLAGDGPDRGRIMARFGELGLANLTIHPPIPKEQTRAFYNSCDLCLVPLAPVAVFQETIPSKLFEILACERPVLASLGGEGQALVERSGGGVVVPPGDPDALARAIRRMMHLSTAELENLGRSGRDFVMREYARGAIANRYLGLLANTARIASRSGS
jgi:colanic acid biosynthesis glycosyl transferase WcaI